MNEDEAAQDAEAKAYFTQLYFKRLEASQALERVTVVEETIAMCMFPVGRVARWGWGLLRGGAAAAGAAGAGATSVALLAAIMRMGRLSRGRFRTVLVHEGYQVKVSGILRTEGTRASVEKLVVDAAKTDHYSVLVLPLEVRDALVQALRVRMPELREVTVDLVGFARDVFRF